MKCYTCQDIEAGCSCPDPLEQYEIETIGWAYKKLLAYGTQNSGEENAMMMDRLLDVLNNLKT